MQVLRGLLTGVDNPNFREDLVALIDRLPSDSHKPEMVAQFVTPWAYYEAPSTAEWRSKAELSDYEHERASPNLLLSWMDSDANAAADRMIANAAWQWFAKAMPRS